MNKKNIKILLIPICFLSFFLISNFFFSKCNEKRKNKLLEYYRKNNVIIIGKVIKKVPTEKNGCLLYINLLYSNVKSYSGMDFYKGKDILIDEKDTIISYGYNDRISINDSLVTILNQGLFRVYRGDSLILDEGYSYFKNGIEMNY